MTFLLDTDSFTLAYFDRHGVRERIATARRADTVGLAVVTVWEVLRGRIDAVLKAEDAERLRAARVNLRRSEAYLAEFPAFDFDDPAPDLFEQFSSDRRIRKAGRNDLLIACVALAHGATLVSRNTKDFQGIPNLKLKNWAD